MTNGRGKPPSWALTVSLIEKGFTERQIEEDFTLETLNRLVTYKNMESKAQEAQQRRERSKARASQPQGAKKPIRRK